MPDIGSQFESPGEKKDNPEKADLDTDTASGVPESVKDNKRRVEKSDVEEEMNLPTFVQELLKDDFKGELEVVNIDDASRKKSREEWKQAYESGADDSAEAHQLLRIIKKEEKEALEQLREKIRGKIFIDIGAGSGREMLGEELDYVAGHEIAKLLEARAYVAIEPNFAETLAYRFKNRKNQMESDELEIPVAIFEDDGLTFLKRLEDSSASLFTSYLDNTRLADKEYNRDLEKEIARVVGDDNPFVSFKSVLRPNDYLKKEEIKWKNPRELDQRTTKLFEGRKT